MDRKTLRLRGAPGLFDRSVLDSDCFAAGEGLSDPLLALAITGIDFLRAHEKLAAFRAISSLDELLDCSFEGLERIVGRPLPPERWRPAAFAEKARRDAELLEKLRAEFIPITSPDYPPQLRYIVGPPFGIFRRGLLSGFGAPSVAMVGTRVPSAKGMRAAFEMASQFSESGIRVVSGLARGIDAAAHKGALRGGGSTSAVLPAGIDLVYPESNRALAAAILDSGGCLVAEHAPGTVLHRYRFPERNRIIAGLGRGCVVVEAPSDSGALITSEHALQEGRDVYVHGACLGGTRSAGTRRLASQGAKIVNNAWDVLADWGMGRETGGASGGLSVSEREYAWQNE